MKAKENQNICVIKAIKIEKILALNFMITWILHTITSNKEDGTKRDTLIKTMKHSLSSQSSKIG